jgi:hypothetical protein
VEVFSYACSGGALHSAFFARRHVERAGHRNREHTMGDQGVASFQTPYLHTIFGCWIMLEQFQRNATPLRL